MVRGDLILVYVLTALCFILSPKGLSSQPTSRRRNVIGIAGMILAIAVTFSYVAANPVSDLIPDASPSVGRAQ